MKEKVRVRVSEEVSCFRDCWDSTSETHYTEDWMEEQENYYDVEVDMDDDGNILDSLAVIEGRLKDIIEGSLIDFEVVG